MRVLITGASSGIGKSLAMEFASLGYDLILVARTQKNLEKVKEEIGNKVLVEIVSLDLSCIDNCYFLYDKFPDIDILVNNAGKGLFGEFVDTSLEKELEMVDLNIRSLHVLMKLYLKDMIKKDQGKILNVASIAGFMPGPLMSTYYATKNYVVSFSEAIREELCKKNSHVRLSILCPGPIATNFDRVAGVDFSLKSLSSDKVAKYAIRQLMRGKFYIVPGRMIRFLRLFCRWIPNCLLVKFVYYQQKRKNFV